MHENGEVQYLDTILIRTKKGKSNGKSGVREEKYRASGAHTFLGSVFINTDSHNAYISDDWKVVTGTSGPIINDELSHRYIAQFAPGATLRVEKGGVTVVFERKEMPWIIHQE